MLLDIKITPFDFNTLSSNPNVLSALSETYCNIWMYDPNFAEYRVCPKCKHYFSEQEVKEGINFCSNGHDRAELEVAWKPVDVAEEILMQTKSDGFYGCLAAGIELTEIAGFAWVRSMGIREVSRDWGSEFASLLEKIAMGKTFMYFDELAIIPSARRKGIGSQLAKDVCYWMRDVYPERLAFLRTHPDSDSVHIYRKLGFSEIAKDTQHGGDRIMMCVHPCSSII